MKFVNIYVLQTSKFGIVPKKRMFFLTQCRIGYDGFSGEKGS